MKSEHWTTDAFKLRGWRRLLRVPWIARRLTKIKLVSLKGNQPWTFIGRTDAKAETPILWLPDVKSWLTRKDWCWERLKAEEKGMTEDEMVGWHDWIKGYEFEQIPWDRGGQRTRCAVVHGVAKSQIWLSGWKTTVYLAQMICGISHRKDIFLLPQVQVFKS